MGYRLLMLGPPALLSGSRAIALKSRKGMALLLYLAGQSEAAFTREHLHGLLWDDAPADAARRNFNTMLSRLRVELPINCLRGNRDQLGWDVNGGITTDAADFLSLLSRIDVNHLDLPAGPGPAVTSGPPPRSPYVTVTEAQKAMWYDAIALWRGPFLSGFSCDSALYEEWIVAERQRWESRMLNVVVALMHAEKADRRWDNVVAVARRALEIDPLQEVFHRAAMEALVHQGNRSAALAQFDLCRQTLMQELDAEPDAETVALYESIKSAKSSKPAKRPQGTVETQTHGHEQPREKPDTTPRVIPRHAKGLTRTMPPLVGRDREYAQIIDALAQATRGGQNHAVLVHGEAGVGKTRLLSELIDAVGSDDLLDPHFPTLLVGQAYESMLDIPYAPLVDALTPALSAVDLTTGHIHDVWLRELGRLLPDIFVHRPELSPPQPITSGDDRLRLFQAVAKLLGRLPQPVIMTLDDLQWADPFTLSLLAYLLRHPSDELHLTAVITVRSGDDTDTLIHVLNALEREQRLTRLALTNLTKDDTLLLLGALFPQQNPRQAARVYKQSLGHPLHALELMAMLADGEAGARSDAGTGVGADIYANKEVDENAEVDVGATADTGVDGDDDSDDRGTTPFPVPPTVQNVFVGRLARLGEVAADVADAVALFHRGVTLDQLCCVTRRSEAAVVEAVQKLSRAQITEQSDHGVVSIKHDVFRQVVVEKLSPARRIHLHRRAYAVLTAEFTPQDSKTANGESSLKHPPVGRQLMADFIAHAVGGQLWDDALRWTRHAAAVAESLYAFHAAVEYLDMALFCLGQLPDTNERRQQRLDIDLQVAKLDTWSPPDKRDARLNAMIRDAETYGHAAAIPRIRMAQADSLILQGRCAEAGVLLDGLAPLAAHDPRLALGLHAWRGAIDTVVGEVSSAVRHLHRVTEAMGEQVLKPGTSVYAGIAACHAAAGDFTKADAALAVVEQEEKQQGYETLTGKFLTVAATVAYWRGHWNEAITHARQGLLTSRAAENAPNEALSALWLGAAILQSDADLSGDEAGEAYEAVQILEDALAASKRAQSYTRRDFIYAFLALAYARTEQWGKAAETIETGLQLTARLGYKEGRALCTKIQGRIAAEQGKPDPARRYLDDALAQFHALGHMAGARRCQHHLAELHHQTGEAPPRPSAASE